MQQRVYLFITVVLILGALTLSGYSQARRTTWQTSWEYKVVEANNLDANTKLNELGAQGWELVGISDHGPSARFDNTNSSTRFVLKRSL